MAAAGPPAPSHGWGQGQGGGSSSPALAVPGLPGRGRRWATSCSTSPAPVLGTKGPAATRRLCHPQEGRAQHRLRMPAHGHTPSCALPGAGRLPLPGRRPRPRPMLLLHLHSQQVARCLPPAAVTAGHGHTDGTSREVPAGAPGCRLPAALGVFAQHSAESSDDPGRAAVGRCQTPALEHPLASHQPWPRPRRRSGQRQCHTQCPQLGTGLPRHGTLHLRGWHCCSHSGPAHLPPPHQCTMTGGPKDPPAQQAVPVPRVPGPVGREQLHPALAGLEAMGRGGATLGENGACGWQRAQLEQMFPRRTQGPRLSI